LEFSFLFDWRQGGEIVSRTRALGNVGGQLAETLRPTEELLPKQVTNIVNTTAPVYTPIQPQLQQKVITVSFMTEIMRKITFMMLHFKITAVFYRL
jgi:hypothetical protein